MSLHECPKCGREGVNAGAMAMHVKACGRVWTVELMLEYGEVAAVLDPDECWIWARNKDTTSYPYFPGGLAHRVMYELTSGQIPESYVVCHSCDTPRCVNPKHLRVGTQADNLREMRDKGRAAYGDRHWTRQSPERAAERAALMRRAKTTAHAVTASSTS